MFVVTDTTGRRYIRRLVNNNRVVWTFNHAHAERFNKAHADRLAVSVGGSVEQAEKPVHP